MAQRPSWLSVVARNKEAPSSNHLSGALQLTKQSPASRVGNVNDAAARQVALIECLPGQHQWCHAAGVVLRVTAPRYRVLPAPAHHCCAAEQGCLQHRGTAGYVQESKIDAPNLGCARPGALLFRTAGPADVDACPVHIMGITFLCTCTPLIGGLKQRREAQCTRQCPVAGSWLCPTVGSVHTRSTFVPHGPGSNTRWALCKLTVSRHHKPSPPNLRSPFFSRTQTWPPKVYSLQPMLAPAWKARAGGAGPADSTQLMPQLLPTDSLNRAGREVQCTTCLMSEGGTSCCWTAGTDLPGLRDRCQGHHAGGPVHPPRPGSLLLLPHAPCVLGASPQQL